MERLQRLHQVSKAYEAVHDVTSGQIAVSDTDLLDYIESIKNYLSMLHSGFLEILEQA